MNEKLILKNRLKIARNEKKLSQEELSELLNISEKTIEALEEGHFYPSAKLALVLCVALDKKFEDIFYFDQ